MKRKLRIDLLKKACLPTFGLRVKALMLFVLFALLPTKQVSAQCIGPYQEFESVTRSTTSPFTGNMIAKNWSFSTSNVVVVNSGTQARSGINSVNLTNVGGYVQTPLLASPDVFSFYLKSSLSTAGRATYYKVEWSTDITFATITGTSGLLSILNTNYQSYSVSLSGLTNVYVRVTLDSFQSTVNVLFLDDFSWTSTNATQNTVVAPVLTGTNVAKASLGNCAGGTVVVNPTATYNFYDNGGDSDQYDLNQTNQVTFVPSGAGFAAGDRVRIQFISYAVGAGEAINVWDSSSTFNATTLLLNHTGTGMPANPTYISSASTDGAVTIRFTSDGATNGVGYSILVDVVRCATPINLTAPTVGTTTATLNWNATAAGNYDVYYSTSAATPMSSVTPLATVATNSASLTGLSASQTYYAWVRSRCGSSPDSYSPWSAVVSFTTVDCSAFVVSTNPSASPASYCVGNVATDLTAGASGGTVSSYQWYSNAANNNTTGTLIVGATSATHKPQTAFGNVRYYYCVITSTLGCTVTTATSGAITVTAPPSFPPTATAGTLVTGTSFQANWLAVGGATAYYLDVSTVNTFASFVPGYSNLAVGNVLLRSVTGLSPGTTYYYRVRAGNSCSTGGSNSGTITVTTTALPYCTPTAPATTTTSVNSFSTTGGISNISNLTTGFTAGGYANYTAQSCSQYPGSAVNYSITSLRTDSTDQTFYYYIWVDWNSDADFDDAGETILATTTYQAGPFTGSVLVPAAQPSGNYRMRVSTSWIGANTSCAINATYGRGEMEDYTITVVPVPPCAPSTPSALTATGVFATGATISWTDAALTPNSVYDYYVSTSAVAPLVGTTPTGTVTGANSVALTGLTLGQTYYFWVRSNCGTPNPWIGSSNFTTVNIDIITMTNGSMTTCNARFYDSGGPGGNYANNETYTYTIYPTAGSKLKVVFNSFFSETNYDGLMVYNGNSTAAPLIPSPLAVGTNAATAPAGSYRGQNTGAGIPGTFISTAADGSLTFRFTSDNSLVYAGWDAVVSCVVVPIITSFTPTGVCAGSTPTVTLTGSNFTGATGVAFNGVPATFTVVSSTSITATLPAAATTGYITVTNSQGVGSSTTVFNVSPVPSTPNAGSDVSICNGGSGTTLNGSASSTSSSVVLTENFNSGAWPSSWTRTINGGFSPGDFRTPLEFLSGGNTWVGNGYTGYCSYFYTYLIGTGTSGDMVSPAMDLTPFNVANLTFWIYNSSGTDVLRVYANNNNGAFTQVGSNYATYGAWTQITVNLNAYTGSGFSSVRLKFTATSDGGTTNIGVDDIEVTGSNTSSFVWSPATGLSSTSILNPVANPTSTTTYTLTTSYGSGCSATDTVVVTVNPKPTVTITTPAANVCANSVIPVNVTGTAATYAWTSSVANTLFSDATGTTPYIPGTNTTIIYVKTPSTATITATGTSALGCPETSTVVFSVVTRTFSGGLWTPAGPPPPATGGTDNLQLVSSWTGGSISGCSCTVTGGATVFNSGQTLSLTNGLTVSGGSVTFNNGASLLQTNNVANTGNITYIRNTTPLLKFDYTYWSTPVSPLTLSQVSPTTPLFFEYNSTTEAWVQDLPSTVMTPAKGYIIRAPVGYSEFGPAAIYTASLVGVPNNGTYTIPVVGGANQLNLLGNPYPSAIDAASFVSDAANTSVIDGTIYLWTHNTPINVAYQYAGQDYAVWNILGGAGTYASPNPGLNTSIPNGFIAAGQGFFIKGLSSGSATFKNSMRVSGNNTQFFRTSAAATTVLEKHRVWLEITNNENAYKQLLIGHITGGTDGLDRAFDGEMVDIGANVTFYTKVDNTKLSIQGRGLNFADTDTYALGYKSLIASNYTIRLSDFDGLFTNQNIYLEDTVLNIIHDLKASPYVFTSGIGTFEDRFVLRFNPTALGVDDAAFTNSNVLVYKNGSDLMVESTVANLKEVHLYDVRGRLIASNENINQLSTRFKNLPIANQVLLVKITSDTGVVLTKKVIY